MPVSAASARFSGSPPYAIPTRFFAPASSGMITTEASSRTLPTVEQPGSPPPIKLEPPSTIT